MSANGNSATRTQTYYLVANKLYPNNPSLEDELNRLLGWNSGNYLVTRNDFVHNGVDSEHCPDEPPVHRTNVMHGPPGFRGQIPTMPTTSNNNFFASPPPQPSPQPHTSAEARGITSSAFPSANRRSMRKKLHCSFCKNNGERELVYASHNLKMDDGKIICPILRNYTCPICHVNGDNAHTLKYCPMRAPN